MEEETDPRLRRELLRRMRELNRPAQPEPTEAAANLRRLDGVRAVLLDVYGTMLTSGCGEVGTEGASLEPAAVREALEVAGFDCLTEAAPARVTKAFVEAIRRDHAKQRQAGVAFPEVEIRRIWGEVLGAMCAGGDISGLVSPQTVQIIAVEYEGRVNPAWPMPGLRNTLEQLAGRGIKLGIVSNAQFYTPLLLEALEDTGWDAGLFDPDLCAFSYKLGEAKPSPRLVRHTLAALAAKHSIAPGNVICVGNDRIKDIAPARDAGCRTALFAGDRRSLLPPQGDPAGAGIDADITIVHISQLAEAAAY
jgi:putative hydrolase of the HAD superfamily